MPITLREFEAVFPSLVEDLSQHAQSYKLPENALKWFQDVRSPCSLTCMTDFNSPIPLN